MQIKNKKNIIVLLLNGIYYYLRDQQGSVVGISNGSGTVVREYEYDGFGKAYVKTLNGKIEVANYTGYDYNNTRYFTSREYDDESGLYYYRARYYDATLGRFISRDPVGQADDFNPYAYVGNNPVNFSDPMGLEKMLLGGNQYKVNSKGVVMKFVNGHRQVQTDGDYRDELSWYDKRKLYYLEESQKESGEDFEKKQEEYMDYVMMVSLPGGGIASEIKSIKQVHHFLTNKNTYFTPKFEGILKKYGLDLNGEWNKSLVEHTGRHAEQYHRWILEKLEKIDNIADGSKDVFLKEFEKLKKIVVDNPDMMYKRGW